MMTFDEHPDFPFSFSSVSDETKAVVRAYNAVCIPGFFVGFNTLLPKPQFRGSLDVLQADPAVPEAQRNSYPEGFNAKRKY